MRWSLIPDLPASENIAQSHMTASSKPAHEGSAWNWRLALNQSPRSINYASISLVEQCAERKLWQKTANLIRFESTSWPEVFGGLNNEQTLQITYQKVCGSSFRQSKDSSTTSHCTRCRTLPLHFTWVFATLKANPILSSAQMARKNEEIPTRKALNQRTRRTVTSCVLKIRSKKKNSTEDE